MYSSLEHKIYSYFKDDSSISKDKLVEYILKDFPKLKKSSINVYLSRLKKEDIIKNPSRSVYTLKVKNTYIPSIDEDLARLFKKLKKNYPFAKFCIWDTQWLNEFMKHQPLKFYTIIELDREVTESVFFTLKASGKNVFIEPDVETFNLYINNTKNVIILKHLISESPLKEIDDIVVPSLEKLLVDMTIEKKVYSAQQNEIEFIYKTAFQKYEVNTNKMKRYAQRRHREYEVLNLTDLTLANN